MENLAAQLKLPDQKVATPRVGTPRCTAMDVLDQIEQQYHSLWQHHHERIQDIANLTSILRMPETGPLVDTWHREVPHEPTLPDTTQIALAPSARGLLVVPSTPRTPRNGVEMPADLSQNREQEELLEPSEPSINGVVVDVDEGKATQVYLADVKHNSLKSKVSVDSIDSDALLQQRQESITGRPACRTYTDLSKLIQTQQGEDHIETVDALQKDCPCLARCIVPFYNRWHEATRHQALYEHHHKDLHVLKTAVENPNFDLFVAALIIANSIVIIIQLEYAGHIGQISLGVAKDTADWENADTWFWGLEHVFNGLFVLELIARLAIMKLRVFSDKTNFFDFFIVFVSSLQLYVLDPMEAGEGGNATSVFRIFRVLRFARAFRLVRVLKLFGPLRILVQTCISSFAALLWSMLLLLLIMVISGILLCELLKEFIRDDTQGMEIRSWVFKYYGTSTRSIYTLFEVTLSGCWPNYFRPLIDDVHGAYIAFSIAYITIVVFAIIRIITAIFLKETLQVAANDTDMMLQEQTHKKKAYVKKLQRVFRAVDQDGRGKLSTQDFELVVTNPQVRGWLQMLELEVHDAEMLFHLLDDGDGHITYDEFLRGVMRLKGQARSVDLVAVMHATDKCLQFLLQQQSQIDQIHQRVFDQEEPKNAPAKCERM